MKWNGIKTERMVEDKAKNIQREKYIKILYSYLYIARTGDKTSWI